MITYQNVTKNGTVYPKAEEENGVTYYYDDAGNIVALAVEDGVETVRFLAGRTSFGSRLGFCRFLLRDSKDSFPDVKKLVVEDPVLTLQIPNSLFPNVREVVTIPEYGKETTSPMLVLRGMLQNTFLQDEDTVLDLSGVTSIGAYAFCGCRTSHITNTAQVSSVEAHAFSGYSFRSGFAGHVKMMDTVLMEVEPGTDVHLPDNITAANPDCGLASAKSLVCSSWAEFLSVVRLPVPRPKQVTFLAQAFNQPVLPSAITDCVYKDDSSSLHLEPNPWYEEDHGVIYTKGRGRLVSVPTWTPEFTIPGSVSVIGTHAFLGCHRLKRILIPATVKTIESKAFSNCVELREITFEEPGQVYLEQSAFEWLPRLASFRLPSHMHECNQAIYQVPELQELILPEGLREMKGLRLSIQELSIPASLERMENCCFPCLQSVFLHCNSVPKGFFSSLSDGSIPFGNCFVRVFLENGSCYYIPRALSAEAAERLDALVNTFGFCAIGEQLSGFADCFRDCITKEARQDAAVQLVLETKNASAFQFVKKTAKNIFQRLAKKQHPEADFISLVKTGALPPAILKEVCTYAQTNGMPSLCAYSMEEMKKLNTGKQTVKKNPIPVKL